MKTRILLGLVAVLALVSYDPKVYTQSNPIAADRRVDWSVAGATIATGRTVCYTDTGALDTLTVINAQIAACAANGVVQLATGTYTFAGGVLVQRDNVTLRGNGPNLTFLSFTSTNACNGLEARLCIRADTLNYTGDPGNVVNWTAGYTKGTTVITLSSVANLAVGSVLMLDQLDDSTTDTNTIWIGDTANVHCYACASPSRGSNRAQIQTVRVTAINGTSVTIDPAIMWPNFVSGKTPQAWYPSNDTAVTGVGIEDLSIDSPATGAAIGQTVTIYNAYNVWMKNVAMRHVGEKAVRIYQSTHVTIRDSYVYDKQDTDANQEGSESYGWDVFIGSSNLFENNILEHITSPLMCESGVGNVYAYNYTRDDFYTVSDPEWAQASSYNHGVCAYNLYEGNMGFGFDSDVVHSSNFFHTNFRNRYEGWETTVLYGPKSLQAVAIMIYAANRYQNILGNVLGTDAYHNRYESYPTDDTNCNSSIYAIGWGGNCGDGAIANKTNTRTTLMRWGNYDTVNDTVRWESSEVPTADATYPNTLPGSQVLPSSMYLSAKPTFFGSIAYPPIGPDVTGGNVSGFGGHVNKIPAKACYDNGTFAEGGTTYNANLCPAGVTNTIYVNNQHVNCNNANPGTDPSFPICDLQISSNLNLVTSKTNATINHVEIAASTLPYRLFGTLTETSTGTTWQGMGDSPGDVMITPTVSAVAMGISTTAGVTNVCQFDPGASEMVYSLYELSRPTDVHRWYPAQYSSQTRNTSENGVMQYYSIHARGDQPVIVNTAGTAVTHVEGTTFVTGAVWVGLLMDIAGVQYTIASVTDSTHLVLTGSAGTQTNKGANVHNAWLDQTNNEWRRKSIQVGSVVGTTVNLDGTGEITGGTNPFIFPTGRTLRDSAGVDRTILAYPAFNQLTVSSSGTAIGNGTIESFDTPCPNRAANCGPQTTADQLDVVEKMEMSWAQDMSNGRVYFHPSENRACSAINSMEVGTTRIIQSVNFKEDNTTLRNVSIWGQHGGNVGEARMLGGTPLNFGGNGSLLEDVWTWVGLAILDFTNVPTLSAANMTIQDNVFGGAMGPAVSVASGSGKFVSGLVIQRNLFIGREGTAFSYTGPGGIDADNRVLISRNYARDSISYRRRAGSTSVYDWYQDKHFATTGGNSINGQITTHVWFIGGSTPSIRHMMVERNVLNVISDELSFNQCVVDCVLRNNFLRAQLDLSAAGGANTDGSIALYNNVVDNNMEPLGLYGGSTGPLACRGVLCPEISTSSNNVWFTQNLNEVASQLQGGTGEWTLAQLQSVAGHEVNSQAFLWNTPQHLGAFSDRTIPYGLLEGGDDYRPKDASSILVNAGNNDQCAWVPLDGQCDAGAYEYGQHTTTGPWNSAITYPWLVQYSMFTDAEPLPEENGPPVASAGADQTIEAGGTAILGGSCQDFTSTGTLTCNWTWISGCTSATFFNAANPTTSVTFGADTCTSILRLTAGDGEFTHTDDVSVTVNAAPAGGNTAPVIGALPDIEVGFGTCHAVTAVVTDDGQPLAMRYQWRVTTGPFTENVWTAPGGYHYLRNTQGSDSAMSAAYLITKKKGLQENVVFDNSTGTVDPANEHTIAFKAVGGAGTFTYFGEAHLPAHNGSGISIAVAGPTQSITPPSAMAANDLVVVFVSHRNSSKTITNSVTGGQNWTSGTNTQNTGDALTTRMFSAIFDGTWTANPEWTVTSGTEALTIWMVVMRPSSGAVVSGDVAEAITQDQGLDPTTVTGPTTVTDGAVVFAFLAQQDSDRWNVLPPGGPRFAGQPDVASTTICFPTIGTYTVELFVSDSELTATDSFIAKVTTSNVPVQRKSFGNRR